MTATTTTTTTALQRAPRLAKAMPARVYPSALAAWHGVHAVLAIAAAVAVIGAESRSTATTVFMLLFIGLVAAADLAAVIGLRRRRQSGRMAAIVVDYLTFFGATVVLLQHTAVFTGLDALGESFVRGVPFLLLGIVAFAATAIERLRLPARRLGLLAGLVALVAVGAVQGLLTFVTRLADPTALALLVLALLSLVLAIRTSQEDVARVLNATTKGNLTIQGLLFVSPNLLGFLAFFAGPLLFSLYVSLNDWDAFGTPDFIGLANYVRIFSLTVASADAGQTGADVLRSGYAELWRFGSVVVGAQDPLFWRSITNIVIFAALAIPLSVVPALFLATLLNADVPGIKAFRAIYFVPSIAGVVAVALIWKQLFNSTVGWINYLISVAASAWNALPLLPEVAAGQPQWLSDNGLALISLVIVFAWQYVGFNTVLFLAGLQSVDPLLHEAAMIDGASRWQRFRYITIPQLAPTTFFVVASTGILALQLFGEAVVLFPSFTPIGAGPQNSTLTPVVYLYDQGFRRFAQGYASAVAWVLFLLIFAFTFVQFQRQRAEVEGP